jgi:hypothetical protein
MKAIVMKKVNCSTRFLALAVFALVMPLISGPAAAQDDGARTYWKGRAGTNAVSVQYLNMNLQASDTVQFDPSHYIYPAADAEADIFILSWARHMTLFDRPSILSANLVGGSVDVEFDTAITPPEFLPPGVVPGASFSQSASGFADPSVQLDVNLFGTPKLPAIFSYMNYEPTWTLDAAFMLGVPLGQYDGDQVVNLGLNRLYGRLAFPFKYHFRVFFPGLQVESGSSSVSLALCRERRFPGTEIEERSYVAGRGALDPRFYPTLLWVSRSALPQWIPVRNRWR